MITASEIETVLMGVHTADFRKGLKWTGHPPQIGATWATLCGRWATSNNLSTSGYRDTTCPDCLKMARVIEKAK